jgi:hypothetical protein
MSDYNATDEMIRRCYTEWVLGKWELIIGDDVRSIDVAHYNDLINDVHDSYHACTYRSYIRHHYNDDGFYDNDDDLLQTLNKISHEYTYTKQILNLITYSHNHNNYIDLMSYMANNVYSHICNHERIRRSLIINNTLFAIFCIPDDVFDIDIFLDLITSRIANFTPGRKTILKLLDSEYTRRNRQNVINRIILD